jgi:hypothetical protein
MFTAIEGNIAKLTGRLRRVRNEKFSQLKITFNLQRDNPR